MSCVSNKCALSCGGEHARRDHGPPFLLQAAQDSVAPCASSFRFLAVIVQRVLILLPLPLARGQKPAGEARPRWMYIPLPLRASPGSLAPSRLEKPVGRHVSGSLARSVSVSRRPVIGHLGRRDLDSQGRLPRRQSAGNPADSTNAQIGIVVGVVLGVFILGLCVFLYIYRYSIKFSYRKRRNRRHKSSSSKSSKSSKSSEVGPPPPADAPPPPAPAEEGT